MKERYEVEDQEYYAIPPNFQNGLNIIGYHFDTRNFFEGLGIGAILGTIVLMILLPTSIDIGTKIGIILGFVAIGLLIGCKGINDEPVTAFISNYFKFRKRRRTAHYNRNIKLDKSFAQKKREEADTSFAGFLKAILNKIKSIFGSRSAKRKQLRALKDRVDDYYDAQTLYFEDDEGYIEKPEEYMSDKEIKEEVKKKKKHDKEIKKKARELEMERRYRDGK